MKTSLFSAVTLSLAVLAASADINHTLTARHKSDVRASAAESSRILSSGTATQSTLFLASGSHPSKTAKTATATSHKSEGTHASSTTNGEVLVATAHPTMTASAGVATASDKASGTAPVQVATTGTAHVGAASMNGMNGWVLSAVLVALLV